MNGNRGCGRVEVTGDGEGLVSFAGAQLVLETSRATGLDDALRTALATWRRDRARHDPGKVALDLAASIAIGGDCLADVAVLREQPRVFGAVASDPTVSRCIDALAGDVDAALAGVRTARAAARARSWAHRRPVAGNPGSGVTIDLDATVVVAHSEKESAAPTFKRTFGFHPLLAFADHGPAGTGEPLAGLLRPGSANANTALDHITVLDLALAQLPATERGSVLVRGDSGAGTKAFLAHITALGLAFSVGFPATDPVARAIELVPPAAWTPAYDGDGHPREGAQVAELTGLLPGLTDAGWPTGMRVIARRERPHPGAQLRLTDAEGWRITLFATSTAGGQLADLELRHRQRARAEDRIRALKDSGLRNLPLHDLAQNRIWLELVLVAADLLSWTQTLALHDSPARRWEPKRLRLRLLAVAGRLVRGGRRTRLKLARTWQWTTLVVTGVKSLQALSET